MKYEPNRGRLLKTKWEDYFCDFHEYSKNPFPLLSNTPSHETMV